MIVIAAVVSAFVIFFYFRKRLREMLRENEWWLLLLLFCGVFTCVCPPLLLVVDIDSASVGMLQKAKTSYIPWMHSLWSAIWWLSQLWSWVILPLCQDYDGSGEFTFKKRLWAAFKFNVKFYLVIGVVCGALLVYAFAARVLDSIDDLQSIGMAAANAFGLTLLVFLLSTGLVAIPKDLWQLSDKDRLLRRLLSRLPNINDQLENAKVEWDEHKSVLQRLDTYYTEDHELYPCHRKVTAYVKNFEQTCMAMRMRVSSSTPRRGAAVQEDEATREALVNVHASLKRSAHTIFRLEHQYTEMTAQCVTLESAQGFYWTHVRKYLLRTASLLLGLLSAIIVWSEAVLPFTKEEVGAETVSMVQMMVMGYLEYSAGIQVIVFGSILSYMAVASYRTVFQFKYFEMYSLTPSTSNVESMSFVGVQATRVIMPLCYNFLNMICMTSANSLVMYSAVFGGMDTIVFLGPWFNRTLPVLILVLSILHLTGAFQRITQWCGVQENNEDDETQNEGRELVRLDRRQRSPDSSPKAAESSRPLPAPVKQAPAVVVPMPKLPDGKEKRDAASIKDKYRNRTAAK